MKRRTFIKAAGVSSAATLMSGLPTGWVGAAYADDSPEVSAMRFGIIALTDCAPIVMAHELGYFKKFGIESTVSKEASWAVIRDKLSLGENHATHMLIGMPLASTMGLAGSPVKPMVIPWLLNRNGQAITLNNKLKQAGVKKPADVKPLADKAKAGGEPLAFAMTFPTGTHAMWIRYWLASGGIHPDKDVSLITIPPPQMVANMKANTMEAFCVGEPWHDQLISQKLGYTAVSTGQMWMNHPEKSFAMRADWVAKYPQAAVAITAAIIDAQRWADNPANVGKLATIIGGRDWLKVAPADIQDRLAGNFNMGDGRVAKNAPFKMKFWAANASFPWKSHELWFLVEEQRWGKLPKTLHKMSVISRVNRSDLWRRAAMLAKVPAGQIPRGESRGVERFFDGKTFNPANPQAYLASLAIKR